MSMKLVCLALFVLVFGVFLNPAAGAVDESLVWLVAVR